MVQYTETGTENVYNLAFGDYDEETNNINDITITNNAKLADTIDVTKVVSGDIVKVYAGIETIGNASVHFLQEIKK